MKFKVFLEFDITSRSIEEARSMAISAYDHLYDTYNDDRSLSETYNVEVLPLPPD